jgi:hypothetical protein
MKLHIPSVPIVLSSVAVFVSLGGGVAFAAGGWSGSEQQVEHLIAHSTAANADRFGGRIPSRYLQAKHFASSGGERFLNVGQTVTLGQAGHFTFTASCTNVPGGAQEAVFSVVANTTADLDGTGPMAAGTRIVIHTDSDGDNTTTDNPLNPGDFTQVGSASSSTEIAADGQEVDVFYNDGVNWPSVNGSAPHACFAGYTGFLG